MGNTKKEALVKLDAIKSYQLVEVSKWEKLQKKIVKDNPYIEITDNASYIKAKASRTALLKGRTSLRGSNGQEGIIRSAFKTLLAGSMEILKDLSNITEPHYDKQQEEVKRWEAILEEKRAEKLRIKEEERKEEEKRVRDINDKIEGIYQSYKDLIDKMEFKTIDKVPKFLEQLKERDTTEFDEFEVTFYKTVSRIEKEFDEKVEKLHQEEELRAEKELQAAERKKIDEEKKKIKEEKDRLAKIEADRKAEEKAAKEEKERIAKEKKEAKRLKKIMPDKEKAQAIIDSLKFEPIDSVKDRAVKALISSFAKDIARLIDTYTDELQNLK